MPEPKLLHDGDEIYVVTQGSYSDYSIVAVFFDYELAEGVAKAYSDSHDVCKIEIYHLNPLCDEVSRNRLPFNITMYRDGDGWANIILPENFNPDISEMKLEFGEWWHSIADDRKRRGYRLLGLVYAMDEEHAVKIANERRAMLIANDQWPPDEELPH